MMIGRRTLEIMYENGLVGTVGDVRQLMRDMEPYATPDAYEHFLQMRRDFEGKEWLITMGHAVPIWYFPELAPREWVESAEDAAEEDVNEEDAVELAEPAEDAAEEDVTAKDPVECVDAPSRAFHSEFVDLEEID